MLYGRRVAQQPPPPSADDLDSRLHTCPYILLIASPAVIAGERADAYYPQGRLSSESVEPLAVWPNPNDAAHPTAVLDRAKPST
jgi:hypothetical protein